MRWRADVCRAQGNKASFQAVTIFGPAVRVEVLCPATILLSQTCDDDVEDAHLTRRRRHRRRHLSNVATPSPSISDLLNFFLRPACILSVPRRETPAIITYLRQLVCPRRRAQEALDTNDDHSSFGDDLG